MKYVDRILQQGEVVRHTAKIHWIVYMPGVAVLIAAFASYLLSRTAGGGHGFWSGVWHYLAIGLVIIALIMLFLEWLDCWITEIAVTNRRIIYKVGLIQRRTNELNMERVESVRVNQSILGRILNYGDVYILGTGQGSLEHIKNVSAPLDLRNTITGA